MDVSSVKPPGVSKDTVKEFVAVRGRVANTAKLNIAITRSSRKSISRLPRIIRTPPIPPVTKRHNTKAISKSCCDENNGGAPKPGSSQGRSTEQPFRRNEPISETTKLKQSNIPRPSSPPGRESDRNEPNQEKTALNSKNSQRPQMVNINPDFTSNPHPDSKSLAIAKPIPALGPVFKELNNNNENQGLNEWFDRSDIDDFNNVPTNSFVSSRAVVESGSNESGDTRPSITDVDAESTDTEHRLPELAITSEPFATVFKTTDENIKDWLTTDIQSSEPGHPTMSGNQVELNMVGGGKSKPPSGAAKDDASRVIQDASSGEPSFSFANQMNATTGNVIGEPANVLIINIPKKNKSGESTSEDDNLKVKNRSSQNASRSNNRLKDNDTVKIRLEVDRKSKSKSEIDEGTMNKGQVDRASRNRSPGVRINTLNRSPVDRSPNKPEMEWIPVSGSHKASTKRTDIEQPLNITEVYQSFTQRFSSDRIDREKGSTSDRSPISRPIDLMPTKRLEVDRTRLNRLTVDRTPVNRLQTDKTMNRSEVERTAFNRSPHERSPLNRSPAIRSPVERSPISRSPTIRSPHERSPISRSPTEKSPMNRSPIERSPASRSPINRSPNERSPATRSPSERSPVSRSPVERSPSIRSPADRSPMRKLDFDRVSRTSMDQMLINRSEMDRTTLINTVEWPTTMDNRLKINVENDGSENIREEYPVPKKQSHENRLATCTSCNESVTDKLTSCVGTEFCEIAGSATSSSFCCCHSDCPLPVPSYVDCPSEVLQRTTNLETAVYVSDHHNMATATGGTSHTESIAGTDPEVREDFSQYMIEQMDYLDNQSDCQHTPAQSHSNLTYELQTTEQIVSDWEYPYYVSKEVMRRKVTTPKPSDEGAFIRGQEYRSRYKKLHVESPSTMRKRKARPIQYRYTNLMHHHPTPDRQETIYDFYVRYKDFTHFRPQFFKMCRVCRHRLNCIWKKTKRWNLWNKHRLSCREFEAMSYIQRTMLWEDVDVQTSLIVFCETGTLTEKDQRAMAITTSLRLNSWLASYNKMHEGTSTRLNKFKFPQYISRGPSMFPLFKSNTSARRNQIPTNGAKTYDRNGQLLQNPQGSCQTFSGPGRVSWISRNPFNNDNKLTNSEQISPPIGMLLFNSSPARHVPIFQTNDNKDISSCDGSTSTYICGPRFGDRQSPFVYKQRILNPVPGPTPLNVFTVTGTQKDCNIGTEDPFLSNSSYIGCLSLLTNGKPIRNEAETQYEIKNYNNFGTAFPETSEDAYVHPTLESKSTDTPTPINIKATLDMALRSLTKPFKKSSSSNVSQKSSNCSTKLSQKQTTVAQLKTKFSVPTQTVGDKPAATTVYTKISLEDLPKAERAVVTEPKNVNLTLTDVDVMSISSVVLAPTKGMDGVTKHIVLRQKINDNLHHDIPPDSSYTKSDIYSFEESTSTDQLATLQGLLDELLLPRKLATGVGSKDMTWCKSIGFNASEFGQKSALSKEDKSVGNVTMMPYTTDCQIQYCIDDLPKEPSRAITVSTNTDTMTPVVTSTHQVTSGIQVHYISEFRKTNSQSVQYIKHEDIVDPLLQPVTCSTSAGNNIVTESRGFSALAVSRPRSIKSVQIQYTPHSSSDVDHCLSAEVATDVTIKKSVGEMTTQLNIAVEPDKKKSNADATVQYSFFPSLLSPQRSEKIGRSQLMSVFNLSASFREISTQLTPSCDQETSTKPEDVNVATHVLDLAAMQSVTTSTRLEDSTANTLPPVVEVFEATGIDQDDSVPEEPSNESVSPLPISVVACEQRTHSCPLTQPDFDLNSLCGVDQLNAQLICLSRLMGKNKWTPCGTKESSSLSPDKWMRHCGFGVNNDSSKEYQSLLDLQKATSASLNNASIDLPKSKCTAMSSKIKDFNNLGKIRYNKLKDEASNGIPEPLTTLSKDSLADVLPARRQSKVTVALSSGGIQTMVDKVTSDEQPKIELKEHELQATPDRRNAATTIAPNDLTQRKSAGAFTSRVVLPPGYCIGREGTNQECRPDCVFVYDHPRCLVHHKTMVDACIQQDPSIREVKLAARKEHAVDEDIGFSTSTLSTTACLEASHVSSRDKSRQRSDNVIREVLSPRVYKALYETSKLVAKSLPLRPSSNVSNVTHTAVVTDHERGSDLSTQIFSPAKVSAAMLTTDLNYSRDRRRKKAAEADPSSVESPRSLTSAVTAPFEFDSGQHCSISTQPADSSATFKRPSVTPPGDIAMQYCSGCRARLGDAHSPPKIENCCGSTEKCMKSQLMACEYYSNILKQHVSRVTHSLKQTLPSEALVHHQTSHGVKVMDMCPMNLESCEPQPQLKPSVNHALSATDICGNDRKQLKMVYFLLTAIEGRIRRLRSNMPN